MLPFALRRLGFDFATSSALFVATLSDVTGLIIHFSIAAVTLGEVIHLIADLRGSTLSLHLSIDSFHQRDIIETLVCASPLLIAA